LLLRNDADWNREFVQAEQGFSKSEQGFLAARDQPLGYGGVIAGLGLV
jgi:hypothetical protein